MFSRSTCVNNLLYSDGVHVVKSGHISHPPEIILAPGRVLIPKCSMHLDAENYLYGEIHLAYYGCCDKELLNISCSQFPSSLCAYGHLSIKHSGPKEIHLSQAYLCSADEILLILPTIETCQYSLEI